MITEYFRYLLNDRELPCILFEGLKSEAFHLAHRGLELRHLCNNKILSTKTAFH